MVPAYLALAESLEGSEKWKEAGVAYGKASAVAPESKQAAKALKKHHLARVKAAKASGEDASTELAIAEEIDTSKTPTESKLLLFAGMSALAAAIVLLLLGLILRKRERA